MLKPVLKPNWRRKRALIISPLPSVGLLLHNNSEPEFDLITFSYDMTDCPRQLLGDFAPVDHFKFESEFWGSSFFKLCQLVNGRYDSVLFMNSDLYVSISVLNTFFDLNDLYELDFSQPSLSANSYISHAHTKHNPAENVVEVPFIEIMMPCLSAKVINEIVNIGITTISGWGLDNYLFPYIQRKLNLKRPAVIHDCQVLHAKPVSSDVIYSNGLSASEEMSQLAAVITKLNESSASEVVLQ
jgi:hypothetical protein